MIRTAAEYETARTQLLEEKKRLAHHEARIREMGLSAEETTRALDPLRSLYLELQEEIEAYERAQRGSFERVINLHGLGRLLIAARIHRGLNQRDLAKLLDVHESQVSRDERNEYRSITVDRAARILDVLQVQLHSELRGTSSTESRGS